VIARIKIKLRMFPTPRSVRIRKNVIAMAPKKPLLLSTNISEIVKSRAIKTKMKKIGIAAKPRGSTK